jgi:hypothetical protein
MRRVLRERGSQLPDKPDDDGGTHPDADDVGEVNSNKDVFGDLPTDPLIEAYDLPDDRLCPVDTPMPSDQRPLARYPQSPVPIEDARLLYESPFTYMDPMGIEGVFERD